MFTVILVFAILYLAGLIVTAAQFSPMVAIPVVVLGLLLPFVIGKKVLGYLFRGWAAKIMEEHGRIWERATISIERSGPCERPPLMEDWDEDECESGMYEDEEDEEVAEKPIGYAEIIARVEPDLAAAPVDDPDADDNEIAPSWDPTDLMLGPHKEDQQQPTLFELAADRSACAYYEILDENDTVLFDSGKDQDKRYDEKTIEQYASGLDQPARIRAVYPITSNLDGASLFLFGAQHKLTAVDLSPLATPARA